MDIAQLLRDLELAASHPPGAGSAAGPASAEEGCQGLEPLMDQVVVAYLQATPTQRQTIRAFFAERDALGYLCYRFARQSASHLRYTSAPEDLRRGLAAISIENTARDYRDTLIALADLYVSAVDCGIKPSHHFRAVAAISDAERPTGGETPTRELLTNFGAHYGVVESEDGVRKHYAQQARNGKTIEDLIRELGWEATYKASAISAVYGLPLSEVHRLIERYSKK